MKKVIVGYGNPVYDVISTPAMRREDRVLSGCSTNACLAVSKLGESAALVGTVGADFADKLEEDLKHWGIKGHLFPADETGGFSLIYDERGDRELGILGVAGQVPVALNGTKEADFILLGPILGEVTADLAEALAKATDAPIMLDPQGLLRGIRDGKVVHEMTEDFRVVAGLSTVVKANELETEIVTGINPRLDPEGAARKLYEYGCKLAVVTLAEAGSVIFDGSEIYTIPPYTTDALDPTGAGDTYAAGFMVKYLEAPNNLTAVGCFASSVASVMVENSGPEFPLTRAEADRRTQKLLNGPLELKFGFLKRE
jgi:sugar/nucleoside kinase (ribokinase family)